MKSIKLSIITINLNNANGLKKTIQSVFSQTFKNIELIVIDGGSTDESVDIIKSYTSIPPSKYIISTLCSITYWTSENDNGIYHAMNKGIKVATGEYCQFLNSGDYLASNDIIAKILTLEQDTNIVYGNMLKMMNNGKILRDLCSQGKITMLNFFKGTLNHSPAFIKRELFDKYGDYDENFQIVSDWKWYINTIIFNNERVKYVNIDVTYFDMSGTSNTKIELDKKERREVLEKILPPKILEDYDTHFANIEKIIRLNRHKVTRFFLWFIERTTYKLEKWKILEE